MSRPAEDPLVAFTGDPEAAALLRRSLTGIAERHPDSPMGRLVGDVLAGRRPVRDLEADADFMDLTRSGVRQFREHLASLTPQERERLMAEAEAISERSERSAQDQ